MNSSHLGNKTRPKERLDQAFGNSSWQYLFPFSFVNNEVAQSLDHRLIIITMASHMNVTSRAEKHFTYEAN